jgi:hypothetical protein
MTTQLIGNIKGDMEWLIKTHIPDMPLNFREGSAIVYGNMDCPDRVDVYAAKEPYLMDVPKVYLSDRNGNLKPLHGLLYRAYRVRLNGSVNWSATHRHSYQITERGYSFLEYSITPEKGFFHVAGLRFKVKTVRLKDPLWVDRRNRRVNLLADLLSKHFKGVG